VKGSSAPGAGESFGIITEESDGMKDSRILGEVRAGGRPPNRLIVFVHLALSGAVVLCQGHLN